MNRYKMLFFVFVVVMSTHTARSMNDEDARYDVSVLTSQLAIVSGGGSYAFTRLESMSESDLRFISQRVTAEEETYTACLPDGSSLYATYWHSGSRAGRKHCTHNIRLLNDDVINTPLGAQYFDVLKKLAQRQVFEKKQKESKAQ